jgi:hypothetical protein
VFFRGTEVTLLGPEWRNSSHDVEIDAEGLKIKVTEVSPGKRLMKMCLSREDKQLQWVALQGDSKEFEFENDFIAVTVVEVDPMVMLSNPPQGRFRIKVIKIPKMRTVSNK